MTRLLLAAALMAAFFLSPLPTAADARFARLSEPGIVAILRHAVACPSHLFHPSQKPWNFASPPDTLSGMHKIIEIFADRAALHTEILALRQQVAVLKRKRPRPLLRKADTPLTSSRFVPYPNTAFHRDTVFSKALWDQFFSPLPSRPSPSSSS